MSDRCPDCASIEHRVALIESRLRALGQGLGGGGVVGADAPASPAPPVPLQALRPKAWAEGQRAARDGIPATACPYKSTRGGFRNAWLGGHGTVTGVAVSGNHPRPVPALLKPKRPAEPPRLSPERRRGIEAGQGGESMSACPFGLNEQRQRDEWQAGWREGRQRRSCG